MKIRISLMALLCMLGGFFPMTLIAQDSLSPLQKGRLNTLEGRQLEFNTLRQEGDKLLFLNSQSLQMQELPLAQVTHVEKQTGTEALKWGLYCAASGFVGSTLGVLRARNSLSYLGGEIDGSTAVPIIAGITAGSGLIGLLIGSSKRKYETVYRNSQFSFRSQRLQWGIGTHKGQTWAQIRFTF